MAAELIHHEYGKSSVRVTRVRRLADRHELVELNVDITLSGAFERSYTHGDNSAVVATDSMKNTVYLLAKSHPLDSPESFAMHLAKHFVETYPQVNIGTVECRQSNWRRIEVAGAGHPTAFESGGAETRCARVTVDRKNSSPEIRGMLRDLLILKTTDSAFAGFVRDQFTTLPETSDRILATELTAEWIFLSPFADFNTAFSRIRSAMVETFATHKSDAVQQTLLEMATAALAAVPSIGFITLRMPNKHRVPFNFKPFGLEFNNDVYMTTDEPSGMIAATLKRKDA